MKKQRGFTSVELGYVFMILLVLLAAGGWVANIVKLVGMLGGEVNTWFIARAVGIFAAPLGAILGFF